MNDREFHGTKTEWRITYDERVSFDVVFHQEAYRDNGDEAADFYRRLLWRDSISNIKVQKRHIVIGEWIDG